MIIYTGLRRLNGLGVVSSSIDRVTSNLVPGSILLEDRMVYDQTTGKGTLTHWNTIGDYYNWLAQGHSTREFAPPPGVTTPVPFIVHIQPIETTATQTPVSTQNQQQTSQQQTTTTVNASNTANVSSGNTSNVQTSGGGTVAIPVADSGNINLFGYSIPWWYLAAGGIALFLFMKK